MGNIDISNSMTFFCSRQIPAARFSSNYMEDYMNINSINYMTINEQYHFRIKYIRNVEQYINK